MAERFTRIIVSTYLVQPQANTSVNVDELHKAQGMLL